MARFSARPTMPPSAMCAGFSSSELRQVLERRRARERIRIGIVVREDDERSRAIENLQQVREHPATRGSSHREEGKYGVPSRTCPSPSDGGDRGTPLLASSVMQPAPPEQVVLDRFGLTGNALESVLGTALERRADLADCYFEFASVQTASLEEGVVKKTTRNVRQGVGVRVLAGARSGYAYSDEVTLERLEVAARTARCIADHGTDSSALASASRPRAGGHDLYPLPAIAARDAARGSDRAARAPRPRSRAPTIPRSRNVMAGSAWSIASCWSPGPQGVLVGDVRPLLRLGISCIAERDGVRTQGAAGGGGRFAFADLLRRTRASASRARRRARP